MNSHANLFDLVWNLSNKSILAVNQIWVFLIRGKLHNKKKMFSIEIIFRENN